MSREGCGLVTRHRTRAQRIERRWSVKHTVIALFDAAEDAQKAAEALKARGFDASAVHVTQGGELADTEVIPPATLIESGPLTGPLHRLAVLFRVEEPHLPHYEEAV